jgi:hypothetical protein
MRMGCSNISVLSWAMAMERLSASFGLIQNKCRKDFGTSLMTYTMYLLLTQFPTNVDIFSKFKLLYNIIE